MILNGVTTLFSQEGERDAATINSPCLAKHIQTT